MQKEIRARVDEKIAKRAERLAAKERNERGGVGISLNVFLIKSLLERIERKEIEQKEGVQLA
jgi:hypothetical protein